MVEAPPKNSNNRRAQVAVYALVVSVAIAITGWVLAAQGWAKDASWEVFDVRLGTLEESSSRRDLQIEQLQKDVAQLLANQENLLRLLEKIESKLP